MNFKILVVGPAGAGKSCCINQLVHLKFKTEYRATIGVDFHLKSLTIDGKNVKVMLFDIAGQERYSSMTRAYYKDAHGCLVVGDL